MTFTFMDLEKPKSTIINASNLIRQYDIVQEQRSELNMKKKEKTNKYNDISIMYNSVLYTNMALAMLGTTLAYLYFTRK